MSADGPRWNPPTRLREVVCRLGRSARLAGPGEVVVITGRGHDPVQECGRHRRLQDDRGALREALLSLAER
ncbi:MULTISPECIES: hypothetical protein [unclassified Rhodococcus (in: high G+C Gram-positive bacteria)]|uniref:hypothetical protein n=1 Tax=unclassified Rhodococcus (in: high G+C Gram-positive bacteria) TaxID=192944 RepID=UPI0016398F7C|nr:MULTISPECIES: hypothetical protein [unclassified Rhodococcus (in: high G+C Gram-positive bacteria)]MBC2638716.1 hypothetical protein [Rhodococcus sp. 3A]MBC2896543.1 hypothetical protein [Rhodococcus sp. 4CII]